MVVRAFKDDQAVLIRPGMGDRFRAIPQYQGFLRSAKLFREARDAF